MRFAYLLVLPCLVTCSSRVNAADRLPFAREESLAPGKSLTLEFELERPRAMALRVRFADADFAGATISTVVNGNRMLPYHAFGGDTRYDNVKGKPGVHPPVARIEANYVLVSPWLRPGKNSVVIANTGPGSARLAAVDIRPVSGHDLPRYENPIYFDFDVWRQASVMRPGVHWFLDSMLLGIIPGGGAFVMNYSGEGKEGQIINNMKKEAEDARVNWGFARNVFYSIWHLTMGAKDWCEFINVDGKKDTQGKIHIQFAYPPLVPEGTDIALIKPDGYLNAIKPGLDALAPYATDYNITCEQWGPRGQGFGRWWGDTWTPQGYDANRWANNYQTEFSKITGYVHAKNPAAWVCSPHWWVPDIRFLLYDTALKRGMKMSDMTDAMMTHYYSFPFADFTKDGKPVMDDEKTSTPTAKPELQYPGGKYEPADWEKSKMYCSTWLLIPEIAMDWNRYRLSRTEKDMKFGDPKVNHWNDGKPFNFQAGFDGDERLYNNETCVFDRNYSGPAPYQFLYSMFSYSLLPTAGSEAQTFSVTRTTPLTTKEPDTNDLFTEHQQPVNLFGTWVKGAAGTHRLQTKDPLYGDLFGYTGFEQATTGDYIMLCGIKERHHRREPHNAWNLVRRTCYAFVTAGPIFPAKSNQADTDQLFVKTLLIKQAGRDVLGVYCVNFHDEPHQLDISIPTGWTQPAVVQAFDETASDWSDAKETTLAPSGGELHIKTPMPARSPRLLMIYPPQGETYRVFTQLGTPRLLAPWGNGNVAASPTLKWEAAKAGAGGKLAGYEVQLAREMLFRPEDIVLSQSNVGATQLAVATALEANRRYHWRVRAVDSDGGSTGWSQAQAFWYQAAKEVNAPEHKTDAAAEALKIPRAEAQPDLKPFTDPDNLAHTGMPFSSPNYWEGAGEAVDGFAGSAWVPDGTDPEEGRKPEFPAWWAVRFDKPQAVSQAALLWQKDKLAKNLDVQTWDGTAWKTVKSVANNTADKTEIRLDAPVTTRAVRFWITAPISKTTALAEVYVH